jgi:uncharacterized OB-fold protein
MSSEDEFNLNCFYDHLAKGQIKAVKCKACRNFVMPPSSICNHCFSKDLEWVKLNGTGKIISFSEVHVSSNAFQPNTPYVVAVVEMDEGVRLAGVVKHASRNEIDIGSPVSISIETARSDKWPFWARFYFTKATC